MKRLYSFTKKFKPTHRQNLLQKNNPSCLDQYQILLIEPGNFTHDQLNSMRKLLKKSLGKSEKIWFTTTVKHPITSKPVGVRIGKGKGIPSYFVNPRGTGSVLGSFSIRKASNSVALKNQLVVRSPARIRFLNITRKVIFNKLNLNQLTFTAQR